MRLPKFGENVLQEMKKRGDQFGTRALKGIETEELKATISTLEKVLNNIQERKENNVQDLKTNG